MTGTNRGSPTPPRTRARMAPRPGATNQVLAGKRKIASRESLEGAGRVTKMFNNVANSILSGVLKVLGFVTSTVINSKSTRKLFKLMTGEVMLASVDGFAELLSQKVINLRRVNCFRRIFSRFGIATDEAGYVFD